MKVLEFLNKEIWFGFFGDMKKIILFKYLVTDLSAKRQGVS